MKTWITSALLILVLTGTGQAEMASHQHAHQHRGHMLETSTPKEPGQSAFAAIEEIVTLLMADPDTDWDTVNIDALRRHLADMDNVTLRADVETSLLQDGARFVVTSGDAKIAQSIKAMVLAHSHTMSGALEWVFQAEELDNGAALTVTGDADDVKKIQGLGFIGVMTLGMHHQQHHLAIARGHNPH